MLLVEIADSSLNFDGNVKLPLYARVGIAEFWLVDLKRRTVDVHRKPAGEGYLETTLHQPGGQIVLALAPEITVKLDLIFG